RSLTLMSPPRSTLFPYTTLFRSLLMGLADRLLAGSNVGSLKHYQIIALNASLILSEAGAQGDLERIVLSLFDEAVHSGNMVVALDRKSTRLNSSHLGISYAVFC